MSSVSDESRTGRFGAPTPRPSLFTPRSTVQETNSISASQARAARRRAARRDEQAVAAWLRELAGRTR
jgi:hypothetical protein